MTDQAGRVVTFSYDTVAGNPVLADVNRGGVATSFAHDAVGRLIERHQDTDGDGTVDTTNARWSYEASGRASGRMVAGRTVLSAVNYVTGVIRRTDSLGRTTLTSTNADRLPVTAVDALGNQRWFAYADTTRKWNHERDARGRVRRFDHDARGNMVWAPPRRSSTSTETSSGSGTPRARSGAAPF